MRLPVDTACLLAPRTNGVQVCVGGVTQIPPLGCCCLRHTKKGLNEPLACVLWSCTGQGTLYQPLKRRESETRPSRAFGVQARSHTGPKARCSIPALPTANITPNKLSAPRACCNPSRQHYVTSPSSPAIFAQQHSNGGKAPSLPAPLWMEGGGAGSLSPHPCLLGLRRHQVSPRSRLCTFQNGFEHLHNANILAGFLPAPAPLFNGG